MFRRYWPLFLVFAAVLLLYRSALSVYFSQDDFFHFQVSQTDGTLRGFLNLFGFHTFEERGIAFYRPITREALYNISYSLFGLNHLPLRLLSFFVHLVNIALVYLLMQRLFDKREISVFAAFFFGITAANVALLYYLAGGIQALFATMFILLSVIFFWDYLQKGNERLKWVSFAAFLLGLGSHELAAVTPVLLAGLLFVKYPFKKLLPMSLWELWLPFAVLAIYLYLDIAVIGFSQEEQQYQAVFSVKKTLNSLAWYSAWALGLPEMLIDFVNPGLKLNPSLMRHWGDYFRIIFPAFFASLALIGGMVALLLFKKRNIFSDKRLWLLAFWFPAALSPVLLLPLHKSTYYLAPALPGFWAAMGFLLFSGYYVLKRKHKRASGILLGGLVALLLILSAASVRLGDGTYLAAQRGRLAERLINQVKVKYPQLPKGAAVYFRNDPGYPFIAEQWGSSSKQASFILNNEDALQLLYEDPTLRVFYEDLGGVPEDFPEEKIYPVVAIISEK